MPRSPADATRFTATGPYVSSQHPRTTPSSSTQINLGSSAPRNESPQQKIARLRAAAAAAKRGQESQFDQVVRVGRRWADRAHRVTTIGLIGLTAVSAAVAVAGISDMIIHNRRRRSEWLAEQQAKTARTLAEARATQAAGFSLTEDQVLAINRERAAIEADEARRNRPSVFKRTTSWLFGSETLSQSNNHNPSSHEPGSNTLLDERGHQAPGAVLQALAEQKSDDGRSRKYREGEVPLSTQGGMLDQQAQQAVDTLSSTSRSWLNQITGK